MAGVVVDRRTGAALPGARVVVEGTGRAAGEARETTSGRDGSFLACAPPGEGRARLTATWGEGRSRTEEVEAPAVEVRLQVDLGRPTFLLFSLSDGESGRPVEGAAVELRPLGIVGVSDSLGRAVFSRVPPARYEIAVRHLAYHAVTDSVVAEEGEPAELRVALVARALPLEPLEVTVTGRDPYLVDVGFYDRMRNLEEGWWGLHEELQPYYTMATLLRFKRELIIRHRPGPVLVNGRPLDWRYERLSDVPLHRVRGMEAVRCGSLPPDLLRWLSARVTSLDCNALLIWLR